MTDKTKNIQDHFLNILRKEKQSVTIFLSSGVKLQGILCGFDSFCIMLRRDDHVQLVYKHAISTIMPAEAIRLYDGEDEDKNS
ncbi:MAG TPA: RNA chaperone Hfq [Rhodospirillaceae bacterium]|nr:MAG: RNA chaperone Hfq [Alphaproteobacteria bacterium GWF2_58_20]HAU28726.1 RNA chaperone Hfq [Rhodospirillaceae bacterium]